MHEIANRRDCHHFTASKHFAAEPRRGKEAAFCACHTVDGGRGKNRHQAIATVMKDRHYARGKKGKLMRLLCGKNPCKREGTLAKYAKESLSLTVIQ